MSAINLGLARITALLAVLPAPQLAVPIVHVGGTNGKGSVSSYLAAVLEHAALRVGRFNSPHLVHEHDGLQIDGSVVAPAVFRAAREQVLAADAAHAIGATPFELLTATAFIVLAQARPRLDLAIIEVGMGGATDATNVVPARSTLLSVITAIELDHQAFLGDTLSEIATVKAGIVKQGTDVVLALQQHPEVVEAVRRRVEQQGGVLHCAGEASVVKVDTTAAPLVSLPLASTHTYPPLPPLLPIPPPAHARLPLPGHYQLANAAAATLAVQVLRTSPRILELVPALAAVTDEHIRRGIASTTWRGRLDWVELALAADASRARSIKVLVDGAHNPSSAIQLASYLASLPPDRTPTTLILGLSAPRPPLSILTPLLTSPGSRLTKVICVSFTPPAGMPWIAPTPPATIANAARELVEQGAPLEIVEADTVEAALRSLAEDEQAVVAGSLYLAADVYRLVERLQE